MATLVNIHELEHSFASRPLFKQISFAVESGERVGLIGPNGAGKSTLLKILAQEMKADHGVVSFQKGIKIAFLKQNPDLPLDLSIEAAVMSASSDPHEWKEMAKAQELLSKLSLPAEKNVGDLSGGWKKRVAIAMELMKEPELFLLDEPTNHLDVDGIFWLEEYLQEAPFATLTITHDRLFLQRISNRILELDPRNPKGLLSVQGDYATYLEIKEGLLNSQLATEAKLQNTLRRETQWLRQGAKARTTKQQARIQRAGELKDQVEELEYRNQNRKSNFDFVGQEKNPKKLIEAKGISKSYDGVTVVPEMNLLIQPKSRIGLLGSNGCGKSTLIRLLLGLEKPDTGSVYHSENLEFSYFEQNRESLDPKSTVLRAVCPSGDFVDFAGQRMHVRGYLDRFLFRSEILELPVGQLSGGEQSRLLLARLMLKKAHVLILDEPTNDLDIATLDILEDVLKDFPGAVILVSHDRFFLDQVATQLFAFSTDARGKKSVQTFQGLFQWESWYLNQKNEFIQDQKNISKEDKKKNSDKKKFGFNEKRELSQMEGIIQEKEKRLLLLQGESQQDEILSNSSRLLEITQEMAGLQKEIDRLYARWSELEAMSQQDL